MGIDEVRGQIEAWRRTGERYGVAVLASTWRSAPRRPGARFARSETGEICGNVSAGCVEADLAERLAGVIAGAAPGFVSYGVSDEEAHGVGLSCGGSIDVFLEAPPLDDPVWPALLGSVDARDTAILVTGVRGDGAPGHWLVGDRGDVLATDTADRVPIDVLGEAADLLSTGGVRLLESEGTPRLLIEVMLPSRRLVVVGATPVGAALARLARTAAIEVVVVEPRRAYAASLDDEGIPVDPRWPDEALPDLAPDASTAVAVVAHDSRLDGAALSAALGHSCGYVGLLGGGKTRRARFEALRGSGVAEQSISRIRAPIGLDIGAERPAEVAIAILAEIVGVWRGVG